MMESFYMVLLLAFINMLVIKGMLQIVYIYIYLRSTTYTITFPTSISSPTDTLPTQLTNNKCSLVNCISLSSNIGDSNLIRTP